MALPATVNSSLSWSGWKNAHCGPFEIGGSLYMVGFDKTNNHIEVWKSTNGGDTWAEQDAANHKAISATASEKTGSACVDGTKIACVYLDVNGVLRLTKFATATDTWEAVGGGGSSGLYGLDVTGQRPLAVVCRGTDSYVMGYQSATESVMGTAYRRVSVRPYTSGAWGTAVVVEAGVQQRQDLVGLAAGSSSRVHVFYGNQTGGTLRHRSFLSGNTLGTASDAATGLFGWGTGNQRYPGGIPTSYVDGANTKIVCPYVDLDAGSLADLMVARATSADAPTFTTELVTDTAPENLAANSNPGAVAVNGTTVHCFWPDDATQDLWRDNDAGTGTWGTDTEHRDAITVNGINVSKITSAIGILYDDAGTVKFDTLTFGAQTIQRTLTVAQVGTAAAIRDTTAKRGAASVVLASVAKRQEFKPLPAAQSSVVSLATARAYLKTLATGGTTYAQEVLADSPLLYWRLGESSGTTAEDSSPNNRDATYGAGITLGTPGPLADPDTAITLNAANNATVRQSSGTTVTASGTQRTFEGLAYRVSGDQGAIQLIDFNGGALRWFGNNPNFYFGIYGNEAGWPDTPASRNAWFHWVLRFDSSTDVAELFINGNSQGTRSVPSDPFSGQTNIGFGPSQYGGGGPGLEESGNRHDEFAVYSGLLSNARISAHYAAISVPLTDQVQGSVRRSVNAARLGAQASLGTLSRRPARALTALAASLGSHTKRGTVGRSTTQAETAIVLRTVPRILSSVASSLATSVREPRSIRTAAQASLGTLARSTSRPISAIAAVMASLVRRTNKTSAATQTEAGTMASNRAYLRTLTATSSESATILRSLSSTRILAASLLQAATSRVIVSSAKLATAAESATLRRVASRAVLGQQTETAVTVRSLSRLILASVSEAALSARQLSTQRVTTVTETATLRRTQSGTKLAQAPEAGTLQRAVTRSLAVSTTMLASLTRSQALLKLLSTASSIVGSVRRAVNAQRAASTTEVGEARRTISSSRLATVPAVATISRLLNAALTLVASLSEAASVRRGASRSIAAEAPEAASVVRYKEQQVAATQPSAGLIRRTISAARTTATTMLGSLFSGGWVPTLGFPLRARVMEAVAVVKAVEAPPLVVRVWEAITRASAKEPEAKVQAVEPEAKIQADESGSKMVVVNEEGSD